MFKTYTNNNLLIYKSANLNNLSIINHAFFTRLGGVSTGDFASLNTSYNTKDIKDNITYNRNLVVKSFNEKNYQLITLAQQSKAEVLIVTKNNLPSSDTQGDALITQEKGIILGVFAADCVPVLIADPITQTIAAVHAGHNGIFLGIIENTIKKLIHLKTKPENLIVAIGPSIKQEDYEVKIDFLNKFSSMENYEQFFKYNNCKKSYYFSLQKCIIYKLIKFGIKNINDIKINTFSNPKFFFSHRFSTKLKKERGLQISTIVLRGNNDYFIRE